MADRSYSECTMDDSSRLLDSIWILLTVRVMAEVATDLKSPVIIGELLTGIVIILAAPAVKIVSLGCKCFEAVSEVPGLLPTTIMSLVLFFAWLAHAVGTPELLGRLAAGLTLSRRFFPTFGAAMHEDPALAHRIDAELKTHRASDHPHLLRHGRAVPESARYRLELELHLVVLPCPAGRRRAGLADRRPDRARDLAGVMDHRHGDDSAWRGRPDLRRTWSCRRHEAMP